MLRVLVGLGVLAFTVYAVVDCVQTSEERVRGLPKLAWVMIVLLFPPAGGLAWLIAGRPAGPSGSSLPWANRQGGPQDRQSGPKGPDDDPEFLKGL
ncbi:hypothetical protein KEM60_00956 [Austwickia sp. TVS 96-490-7B]|nr:hypothetical protein [Austwickia sp. TVS 96-490-7B]